MLGAGEWVSDKARQSLAATQTAAARTCLPSHRVLDLRPSRNEGGPLVDSLPRDLVSIGPQTQTRRSTRRSALYVWRPKSPNEFPGWDVGLGDVLLLPTE